MVEGDLELDMISLIKDDEVWFKESHDEGK